MPPRGGGSAARQGDDGGVAVGVDESGVDVRHDPLGVLRDDHDDGVVRVVDGGTWALLVRIGWSPTASSTSTLPPKIGVWA